MYKQNKYADQYLKLNLHEHHKKSKIIQKYKQKK